MSTTNYPKPLPLLGPDGKPRFIIGHVDGIIGAAPLNNPHFTGSITLNGIVVLSTTTDDDGTVIPVPLPPEQGGTGFSSLDELAQALGVHGTIPISKGGTGATTAAAALQALGGASTETYTVQVPAGSWLDNSSGGGGYYKSVSVPGMKASDNPVADVILSTDVEASKLQLEAWACVSHITTDEGNITIYCFDQAPTIAMSVQFLCVRKPTGT